MTHGSDYVYLPRACTNTKRIWGRKFPAPHSPLLTSRSPPSSLSTGLIKQGGPVALLNEPDLGMREELVKDNHAL